jgi:hypothetical protein
VTIDLHPGSAFLMPSGPRAELHLHVVLTDEDENGFHLVVGFSSIKKGVRHDPNCETAVGDHKCLTKPSFVFYALTSPLRASHIEKMIAKNYFKAQPDVSNELYKRICKGLLSSDRTPRGMKKYFND